MAQAALAPDISRGPSFFSHEGVEPTRLKLSAEQLRYINQRKTYWQGLINVLAHPMATIDFETRSACDLKAHGSWLYSKHPTTQAMCLAILLPDRSEIDIWHMEHPQHFISESPPPLDLFAFISAGGIIEAHNAFFEKVIWKNVMVARHGWPPVDNSQWRCSAAKASAASLPRDLENAGKAMGLSLAKDMEGRKNMLKMSKPKTPVKAEIQAWMEENGLEGDYRKFKQQMMESVILWHEDEEDIYWLWRYCKQDVKTEEAFSRRVPDLAPEELAVWQADQALNERGARFDFALAQAALTVAAEWRTVLNRELYEMTGVSAATKRQQIQAWLLENENLDLPDTAADTLDWYIIHKEDELSARALRILDIVKQVNRTSIRKYEAMLKKCDPADERGRDLLMYCGAGTGRWTGKGIQVQNFPRGKTKNAWKVKKGKETSYFDMDQACDDVLEAYGAVLNGYETWETALEWLYMIHGDVMELLSSTLRGAICAAPGRDLISADYAAIEARCVLWEADAQEALQVFLTGGDIYCDMATGIYGFQVDKDLHPDQRQFGKQAILGLGYGMGFVTFLLTCRKYDIRFSLDQAHSILKDKFQSYFDWVKNFMFPQQKDGETRAKFANRARQAANTRRKLIEAREEPEKILHELAIMKFTVDVYRTRYPQVKQLWANQESAAMKATAEWEKLVQSTFAALDEVTRRRMLGGMPFKEWLQTSEGIEWRDGITGEQVVAGKIGWHVEGGFLCCTLPSGRIVRYRDPHIKPSKTAWGEVKNGLRYMSVVKGNKWARTSTYGGKLVENITQAVARDIMAAAILRTQGYQGYEKVGNVYHIQWGERSPYDVIMSVHDELVAEVDEDKGSLEHFEELMAETDAWAKGCPVKAEAARYKRYRK